MLSAVSVCPGAPRHPPILASRRRGVACCRALRRLQCRRVSAPTPGEGSSGPPTSFVAFTCPSPGRLDATIARYRAWVTDVCPRTCALSVLRHLLVSRHCPRGTRPVPSATAATLLRIAAGALSCSVVSVVDPSPLPGRSSRTGARSVCLLGLSHHQTGGVR